MSSSIPSLPTKPVPMKTPTIGEAATGPSLRKLSDGAYWRRRGPNEMVQPGDIYDADLDNRASAFIGGRVGHVTRDPGTTVLLSVWCKLDVPAGYRVRELDEVCDVGDTGLVLFKDGTSKNLGPLPPDAPAAGGSVRAAVRRQVGFFSAEDFVVFTPVSAAKPTPPVGYRLAKAGDILRRDTRWVLSAAHDRWSDALYGRYVGMEHEAAVALFKRSNLGDTIFFAVKLEEPSVPPLTPKKAEGHNTRNLTEEQVGVKDGYRLLTEAEVKGPKDSALVEYYSLVGCEWRQPSDYGTGVHSTADTYRTKAPVGQYPGPAFKLKAVEAELAKVKAERDNLAVKLAQKTSDLHDALANRDQLKAKLDAARKTLA